MKHEYSTILLAVLVGLVFVSILAEADIEGFWTRTNATGIIEPTNSSDRIKMNGQILCTNQTCYPMSNIYGYYNSSTLPATGNSSWNETKYWTNASATFYPKSNPLGYYNISTLPALGTSTTNITSFTPREGIFFLLPPTTGATPTNLAANTGRGCVFSVTETLYWNKTYIRTGATNTSVGISMGIYNCSGIDGACTTKTLYLNLTPNRLSSGVQNWTNSGALWKLTPGTYFYLVAVNTTGPTANSVYTTANTNLDAGFTKNCGTVVVGTKASMPQTFTTITGTSAYIPTFNMYISN